MKKGFIDGLLDSLDCTLSSTFQNLSYKEGLKNRVEENND